MGIRFSDDLVARAYSDHLAAANDSESKGLVARAAERIQKDNTPVTHVGASREDMVRAIYRKTMDELRRWQEKSPNYKSFFTTDIGEANGLLRNFAERNYGRFLSDEEIGLFHLFSAMGSPSANPIFDSQLGLRLFDRYLRTGQVSPYVRDGERWDTNFRGVRVRTGIADVFKGAIRGGKGGLGYEARAIHRFSELLNNPFDGDLDGAVEWLKTKHSVDEIERITGRKPPRSEYGPKTGSTFGVFGLTGPKLGSYWLNRAGELSTIT
jgi:hypothetical protein